jgi:CRP-like cAMP-binding protein
METRHTPFPERIGYLIPCVIPAKLLSDEATDEQDRSSLRRDASCEGLSYLQVLRPVEEGIYLARVAATPERVRQGYTVLLDEATLWQARPWDQRLQGKSAEAILTLLHAPVTRREPGTRATVPAAPPRPEMEAEAIRPVETVEVPEEELRDAFQACMYRRMSPQHAGTAGHLSTFQVQQALLGVMIDALMQQLYQTQEQIQARTLKARCLLLAQLQRWHRTLREVRLVHAVPRFSPEQGQAVWRLTAGVPVATRRAA